MSLGDVGENSSRKKLRLPKQYVCNKDQFQ